MGFPKFQRGGGGMMSKNNMMSCKRDSHNGECIGRICPRLPNANVAYAGSVSIAAKQ